MLGELSLGEGRLPGGGDIVAEIRSTSRYYPGRDMGQVLHAEEMALAKPLIQEGA